MSTVFLFPDNPAIRTFAFDLTKVENHTFISTLTKNPIEDGSKTTDHVIVDPAMFSCVVSVSNTPIERTFEGEGALGPITLQLPNMPPSTIPANLLFGGPADLRPRQAVGFQIGVPVDRVKRMLDRLNILRTTVQTMTVATSKHQYDDMVLTQIQLPVEKTSYGEFTLTFEELIVVTTDQVTAPKPKEPRGAPMTSAGAIDPNKEALDHGQSLFDDFKTKSGLRALVKAGGSWLGFGG